MADDTTPGAAAPDVKLKMKVGMAGPLTSFSPGDPYTCSADEAQRLIDAEFAEPWVDAAPATGKAKA